MSDDGDSVCIPKTNFYGYVKSKNCNAWFSKLENSGIDISELQTYYPLLNKLFVLNSSNCNSIMLNQRFHNYDVSANSDPQSGAREIMCIDTFNTNALVKKQTFIKFCPLYDTFKYLSGEETHTNVAMASLMPNFTKPEELRELTAQNPFNPAYVDGFFCFLSSKLLNDYGVVNAIDYYGNVCAVKHDLAVPIGDDLTMLNDYTYFRNNRNTVFKVDELVDVMLNSMETMSNSNSGSDRYGKPYAHKFSGKKPKLVFETACELEVDGVVDIDETDDKPIQPFESSDIETLDINGNLREVVFENNGEMPEITLVPNNNNDNDNYSNVSSNTAYTTESGEGDDDGDDDDHDRDSSGTYEHSCDSFTESDDDTMSSTSQSSVDVNAYIPQMPVNMIFIEQCVSTLDDYLNDNDIEDDELKAILAQLVFTLAIYQHCFEFTHNDLHSKNIMYVETQEKYIYYSLNSNGPVYKIPTYGKIWKIIDFGRAIYKVNNITIENASFSENGDATTQYNFGSFYSPKFTHREPTPYFDLCRLGCGLFNYFFDADNDLDDIYYDDRHQVSQLVHDEKGNGDVVPMKRVFTAKNLILRWITDNDNHNILYKSNGEERYEGFKLYKMIAIKANERCCPVETIKSDYFKGFIVKNTKNIKQQIHCVERLPKTNN